MKKQALCSRYGVNALIAIMAIFSLIFCPCGEANASDQVGIQKTASSQEHDCCDKKKTSCTPDSCSFSSIQTPNCASHGTKVPNFSKTTAFDLVSATQALEAVTFSFVSSHGFVKPRFTGPPTYLKNSLLRI